MTALDSSLKHRLERRDQLVGPLVSIPSPDVAEILALAGFDYLWVEAEHSPMDFAQVQMLIQAVGGRCPCLVRVPENREVWFKKALDTGCAGVVVPQVRSEDEARAAVAWSHYPPLGTRSVGISRAHGFGASFAEYVNSANESLALVVQVEHIEGVQNIKGIVQVPAIDAVFIGPYDLSGSLGIVGQVSHPDVLHAISTVTTACREADVATGIFVTDSRAARAAMADGHNLVAMGMDAGYLYHAATEALSAVRRSDFTGESSAGPGEPD
jgi:2-dehydro-3-deoxyglucarate aldolase/4-hydroxy-2-oxoheptanedioate aldolase